MNITANLKISVLPCVDIWLKAQKEHKVWCKFGRSSHLGVLYLNLASQPHKNTFSNVSMHQLLQQCLYLTAFFSTLLPCSLKTSVHDYPTFPNPSGMLQDCREGQGADWGQLNAKSTHVCNGYTEVIVQRDPPLLRPCCPAPSTSS